MPEIRKHALIGTAALATVAFLVSGCAKKPPKETEPATQAQPMTFMQTEPPTEKPTEPPTEPPTEKPLTIKDVQVKTKKTQRTGTVSYEIADSTGSNTGTMDFQADASAFLANGDAGLAYAGKRLVAYDRGEGWKETEGEFVDLWSLMYDDCEMPGMTDINGRPCYHLMTENDGVSGYFASIAGAAGYDDLIIGEARLDYYVDKETFEVVRATASAEFQANYGDDVRQGRIAMSFESTNADSVSITEPAIVPDVVETEAKDDYEVGTISSYDNVYKNRTFDVQIVGGEGLWFDQSKTDEIAEGYSQTGSSYKEEAYAEGDLGILNVVSIRTGGRTRDAVLEKYMTDSGAQAIQTAGVVDAGSNSYVCSTATINGAATKSYCTATSDRALVMTLYYTDPNALTTFESSLYAYADDPLWQEDSWTLAGDVTVKTPKGYKISSEDSSDLFVCMTSSSNEVNVFSLEGRTMDSEAEREIASSPDTTKETVVDEWLTPSEGTDMRYLVLKCVDSKSGMEYYEYVGLVQKDATTIKFYAVSTNEGLDYGATFTEFANAIGAPTAETEWSDEGLEDDGTGIAIEGDGSDGGEASQDGVVEEVPVE